ncbi:MAG TPA: aromatic acid exporter family protein, partial [Trebonia sp.]
QRAVLRRELRYAADQVAGLGERDSAQRLEVRQVAKATLAAVVAWLVADRLRIAAETLWMAPATAVIMVHATVYQTFTKGMRRVIAVAAGVILAGSLGHLLGLTAVSLAVVVPLAMAAGRWHRRGSDGSDVVTTAVLMLSFGAASRDRYLLGYVVAVTVGALVGGVINTALWPPLYRRRPDVAMQRLGEESAGLLAKVAAGLRDQCDLSGLPEWERRAVWLDTHLTRAASAIAIGAESRRFNLRRARGSAWRDHIPSIRALDQIGVHVHTIVRALDQVARRQQQDPATRVSWISPEFACDYADLLDLLVGAIQARTRHPEDTGSLGALLARASQRATAIAEQMTGEVRAGGLDHPRGWAASGSLFTDAECIIAILTLLLDAPGQPSLADGAATAGCRAAA